MNFQKIYSTITTFSIQFNRYDCLVRRSYPAVLPCGAGQEVRKRLLCQARHPQPAGCTRRRRTHHLHDGSFGIAQGCRPGNEGKAPLGPAHLMQKRALIAMQYSALHHRTWKTPTVQKPCSHGLQNKKAMKSFDFTAFSGAVKQSKSEPFSFDAAWAASSNVMVCVPSL